MSAATIAAGLRVAAHLRLPLTIAGKFIADGIGSGLGPQQDRSLAVATRGTGPRLGCQRRGDAAPGGIVDAYRRTRASPWALCLPSSPSPSAASAVLAYAPLPQTRFDIRTQADRSFRINEAFEVRAVGSRWFVARLGDKYELQSWQLTEETALQ